LPSTSLLSESDALLRIHNQPNTSRLRQQLLWQCLDVACLDYQSTNADHQLFQASQRMAPWLSWRRFLGNPYLPFVICTTIGALRYRRIESLDIDILQRTT